MCENGLSVLLVGGGCGAGGLKRGVKNFGKNPYFVYVVLKIMTKIIDNR